MTSFYNDKKILVTGGTGLIGRPLVKKLISLGGIVSVVSLDKPVDIDATENVGMLIMAILIVVFGILPFMMFDIMSAYSSHVFDTILKIVLARRGL